LDAYVQYIAFERRQKNPDDFVLVGLYERAITEAAKHRFSGEPGAEATLRTFWIGYLDFLVSRKILYFVRFSSEPLLVSGYN